MTRLQEIEARLAAIANEIEQRGAELTAEQLTAFETEVNNLKTERAAKAVPKMLKAGGAVLVKAEQEEIRRTFTSNRVTGDLANSIKCTAVKKRGSGQCVEVYPHGKNRRGERNATVGFVHQYGRSNMPARPWFTRSHQKATPEVQAAMRQAWEDEQE